MVAGQGARCNRGAGCVVQGMSQESKVCECGTLARCGKWTWDELRGLRVVVEGWLAMCVWVGGDALVLGGQRCSGRLASRWPRLQQ